jgi:hypothetical protein
MTVFGWFALAAATYPMGHWTWMDPKTTVSHLGIWTANWEVGGQDKRQPHQRTGQHFTEKREQLRSFVA